MRLQRKNLLPARIRLVRRQGLKSMRGKLIDENLRESHAREMMTRTIVLPAFKKVLKGNLKAVLLTGSSQLGVRKASLKRSESDIDIVVVLNPKETATCSHADILKAFRLAFSINGSIGDKLAKQFGVWGQILIVYDGNFRGQQHHNKFAFQVIYGKNWVEQQLGKLHLEKMSTYREELKTKERK